MNKIRLFLIFQLVYSSYQSDFQGRLLTVMDCLKAIETDRVNGSYIQTEYLEEVANYHAKYMLNKLLISINKISSLLNESVEYYPYIRYRYAIVSRVFTLAPDPSTSIMMISTNCSSNQTYKLKVILQNYFIFCESLDMNNFDLIKILPIFESLRIKIVILLLPKMFTQIILEMTAVFHSEILHYIIVDYIPGAIRQTQDINPLLKISNLRLISSPVTLMNIVNRTECIISKENIFFKDEYDVLSCQHQSYRIIRIVTVFDSNVVFPVHNSFPSQNKCEIGLPCKTRLKGGTWSWLCCAGIDIDRLSAIMRKIKHPFIIYIVEDGRYGSLKNGQWDGLVDDLYQGRADIALARMSCTIERFQVIDYLHEIAENSPITFLSRKPNVKFEILNFSFIPANTETLICFLVLLHLAVFFIVYIFECFAFHQKHGQKYSFKDSWSFLGAILIQRDFGGSATRSWPGRCLAITYAFAMTVLISTYTATLTAENVSYEDSPTFHGMRDKIFKDPTKRVGLHLGGYHERLADLYNHTSKRIGIKDYKMATKHLLEGKLDIIIGTIAHLKQNLVSEKRYCKELILNVDESISDDFTWGCQKNSKLCNLFSLSILRLLEERDFENIDKKWSPVSYCTKKEAKNYPWQYIGGLVICLAVATGICIVILVLETFFASLRWRKRRSYEVDNCT